MLERAGVFPLVHDAFLQIRHPAYQQLRRRQRTFFASFIRRGDLVFDVGANCGDYTDMFLRLGAEVVAVAPTPVLAATIGRRYPRASVVSAALGAEEGTATLHLADIDQRSSLAERFIAIEADHFHGRTIEVPVLTLDDLIGRYGKPQFAKIDVEGYEPEVLQGLTTPLPSVSIEYLCRLPEAVRTAVSLLEQLGSYRFNLTQAFPDPAPHFLFPSFVPGDAVIERVEELRFHDPLVFGDIYATLG